MKNRGGRRSGLTLDSCAIMRNNTKNYAASRERFFQSPEVIGRKPFTGCYFAGWLALMVNFG